MIPLLTGGDALLLAQQFVTTSGQSSLVVPAKAAFMLAAVVGGGGGAVTLPSRTSSIGRYASANGGSGGVVSGILPVSPGQSITCYVAPAIASGSLSGGSASALSRGAVTLTTANAEMIAAGGGGAGSSGYDDQATGGAGGGAAGGQGTNSNGTTPTSGGSQSDGDGSDFAGTSQLGSSGGGGGGYFRGYRSGAAGGGGSGHLVDAVLYPHYNGALGPSAPAPGVLYQSGASESVYPTGYNGSYPNGYYVYGQSRSEAQGGLIYLAFYDDDPYAAGLAVFN